MCRSISKSVLLSLFHRHPSGIHRGQPWLRTPRGSTPIQRRTHVTVSLPRRSTTSLRFSLDDAARGSFASRRKGSTTLACIRVASPTGARRTGNVTGECKGAKRASSEDSNPGAQERVCGYDLRPKTISAPTSRVVWRYYRFEPVPGT